MGKRLIINADDFGLSEQVNKAVEQAHNHGVLTSTTIMANMPAAVRAVKIAKKIPTLGVGVHLNLTEGRPLSKDQNIKCLLNPDGSFACSPAKLSFLSIAGSKNRNAIRTELTAQIQWLIDNGIKPTHLDSHKHIHIFPAIFSIVCELARRFEIKAVRCCFEPANLTQLPWPLPSEGGRKRAKLIRAMAGINRLQNSALLKTDALLGIAHRGKIDVNFFKSVSLYNTAKTAEVMTHPAADDTPGKNHVRRLHHRRIELDALCSEKTREYLKDAAIELVHYGRL
jgi:hopanoid biosynthesis associated protein HpnK